MKVKYIGEYYKVRLIKNKVYDVIGVENGWYRINDEIDDGFYPPDCFEVTEN